MDKATARRVTGWSGIIAAALIVLPGLAVPFLGDGATAQEVKEFYVDNGGVMKVTNAITMLGVPFFLLFAAGVVSIARRLEPEGSVLPLAAWAGAIGTAVLAAVVGVLSIAPVYFDEATGPDLYRAFYDVPFFSIISPFGAVFTGSIALVIRRTGFVPRWMAVPAFVSAAAGIVGIVTLVSDSDVFGLLLGFIGSFLLFFLWILATSIGLLRTAPE